VIRYFARAFLRRRQGRALFLLSLCGVALGVASVTTVELLIRNAIAAFRGSVRAVSGDADVLVTGRAPALPDSLYARVLDVPGIEAAWPVTRVTVAVSGSRDLFLDVLGVDVIAQPPLPFVAGAGAGSASARDRLAALLTEPGWIAVSPDFAARAGWAQGDTVRVSSGSRTAALHVGGLVDFRRTSPLAARNLAVMDIAQVQAFLGRPGELQEIGVAFTPDADAESVASRLALALGPGAQVLTPEARERRVEGLLDSFRLNLTALSLVSLFVGVFLVAASSQAALVRRRHELGVLRVLGASPGRVLALIFGETALLGVLGTALGFLVGFAAARRSMDAVSATLTNIYLLSEIEALRVDPGVIALAGLAGVGGALAGSALPALDASRRDVRSLLSPIRVHEPAERWAPRLAWMALGVALLSGGGYLAGGSGHRYGGFLLAAGVLVALPLITPAAVHRFSGWIRPRGWGWGLSLRALSARLWTASFAAASLAAAVSMLVAITLLVGSFRSTLVTWLDGSLRADVFITTESWARAGRQAVLDPVTLEALRTAPGVRRAERLRQFRATAGDRTIRVAGADLDAGAPERWPLRHGESGAVLRALRRDGAVVISEPLARKTGLGIGDALEVATPSGVHAFPIAGVTYDYSSDAGAALMSLETLERVFGPGPVTNLGLHLEPGVDRTRFVEGLRSRFRDRPLIIREDRELRAEVLRVFDQTFAVTRLLQLMALVVAATGVSLALLVLARERAAELALFRALGATRRQIFALFVGEGMGLCLFGLGLGGMGGIALAAILIAVVNPATFGWTIRPAWPWSALGLEALAVMGATAMASLYPAFRASRVPAGELSRDAL
jgi:putative ABC transport system permease protein